MKTPFFIFALLINSLPVYGTDELGSEKLLAERDLSEKNYVEIPFDVKPLAEDSVVELAYLDLYQLSLAELLQVKVTTAIGAPQSLNDTPAIMTIITKEDINQWHFSSVAEALGTIPGFYCVYDFLSPNCGVRGINGGLRAYSRIIKVMINGHPVNFASDTANFLGPEFIPMVKIKQIEVIRGPASALYGANAFLGVVNVITDTNIQKGQTQVANTKVEGFINSWEKDAGYGASFSVNGGDERLGGGLAFNARRIDRSGHALPSSSPRFSDVSSGTESENDISRPTSAFANFYWRFGDHFLESYLHFSSLNSYAEFLDFGTLSHDNKVSLKQLSFNLTDTWEVNDILSTYLSLSQSSGGPASEEQLSFGSSETFPKRDFGFETSEAVIESRINLKSDANLTIGFDYKDDNEDLIEIYSVNSETLQETLQTDPQGHKGFYNTGIYVQYLNNLSSQLAVTMNARSDDHNIYGGVENYRLGLVYVHNKSLVGKLLYGSSFKAPSAAQLFSKPLFSGEVDGNENLKPEKSDTLELRLQWLAADRLSLSTNGFYTEVDNKIELLSTGGNQTPRNIGEVKVWGVETEVSWQANNKNTMNANVSYVVPDNIFIDPFIGNVETTAELYPKLSANLSWSRRVTEKSILGIRWKYASARRASKSNVNLLDRTPYELDEYQLLSLVYNFKLLDAKSYIKIDNLLDENYQEPGFNGFDIPGRSRLFTWGVSYEF